MTGSKGDCAVLEEGGPGWEEEGLEAGRATTAGGLLDWAGSDKEGTSPETVKNAFVEMGEMRWESWFSELIYGARPKIWEKKENCVSKKYTSLETKNFCVLRSYNAHPFFPQGYPIKTQHLLRDWNLSVVRLGAKLRHPKTFKWELSRVFGKRILPLRSDEGVCFMKYTAVLIHSPQNCEGKEVWILKAQTAFILCLCLHSTSYFAEVYKWQRFGEWCL